ncbi:hypothetical protein [Idiomarina sp.]|uniref:hypothetical protein n=1 Tax=Idiomarina sp. TaxID=1874361 RepID=UPI0025B8C5AD|nr:hypothetical protein [Idiomarina sp.]|tara:strand:- start:931 stop:1101 length:171 start_codon:yes stop_codon:yes gene_type:complete
MRKGEYEKALINDPSTSYWLKEQFEKTAERDPVDALNDAESLVSALRARLKLLAEE